MAFLSLMENIIASFNDYEHAHGVFIDIKQAFDTIDILIFYKKNKPLLN